MVIGLLLLAAAILLPTAVQALGCHGDRPAGTLLFPYFEVDLDGARTTLISIINAGNSPRLTRVTLWTDWALPTASFDLYLTAGDVQTMNLRDLFQTGRGPATGPGADSRPGCFTTLTGETGWSPAQLQAAHTGRDTGGGKCHAEPRADTTVVTGYITVDVTLRCLVAGSHVSPGSAGYFSGGSPVASTSNMDNVLTGDYFFVDPAQNFAGGEPAVHIVIDPTLVSSLYTFYGRFVEWTAADKRDPLTFRWFSRFLTGGGFNGGTHLIVWRDPRSSRATPYNCLGSPLWRPLEASSVKAVDEQGHAQGFDDPQWFPLATQRVPVASLPIPYSFGRLSLELGHRGDRIGISGFEDAQAWVGWEASASERFNVTVSGNHYAGCTMPAPRD